jgi:hypothetical protein
MRKHSARVLRSVVALGCLLLWPVAVHAQGIWSSDLDRGFRPGALPLHDGAPFSHRYNYYTGPMYFPGLNGQQLWNLYHLDREDRAERFGYNRVPPPSPAPSRGLFHRFRRE